MSFFSSKKPGPPAKSVSPTHNQDPKQEYSKVLDENKVLRNQLKELCLTLDTAIEKAVTKNAKGGAPGLPQGTSAFNEKAPKESLKIK